MRRSDSERRSIALQDTDDAAIPLMPRRASAPPPMAHAVPPGTVLAGKYRVVRTIGQGGMGVVLAARHEELDVPVAVKLLAPELIAQPDAVGRFVREARAASRLNSKHVTRVHDIGTLESGEPYIVMEYLAGEDLAYHAKRHRLAIADLVDYVVQACDAIAEAHAAGIVHRDIKPANLFLSRNVGGERLVKVLDFGVAKFFDGPSDVALTGTTTIVGSALYMSPEQMRSSKNVDHRTDIYALGACLYELASGVPPYLADSFAELCAKVYTEEPTPLHQRRGDLPPGFEEAVQKALAHDPARRYQSVGELAQALSPFTYEATRERIRALLEAYSPGLDVLPVAQAQAPSVSPGPIALDRPRRDDDRPRPLLPMWVVAGAALAFGGLTAALVFAWPGSGGGRTEATSVQPNALRAPVAPSAVQAAAVAPTAAAVATPPSTQATPTPATAAPAASPSASMSASSPPAPPSPAPRVTETHATHGRSHTRSTPPLTPAPTSDDGLVSRPSGATTVNSDLSQVSCTQHLPDGTSRKVPCPD